MERGEIWWANFPRARSQKHPVLLLSWDTEFDFREQITVAPVSSVIRSLDAEVYLDDQDGMAMACAANLDGLATIRREDLIEHICSLTPERMKEVDRAIHLALGLELPCSTT